jgi:mitochondrial ribonuclease P protein 1
VLVLCCRYFAKKKYAKARRKAEIEKKMEEKLEKRKALDESLSEAEKNAYKVLTNYPGSKTFLRRMSSMLSDHMRGYAISAFRYDAPKIVFDFQFENATKYNQSWKSLIQQVILSYGHNMRTKDPFCMYLVNLRKESVASQILARSTDLSKIAIIDTEKSYLDLFPKEKLVYLSPDAREDMQDYDEDKIYIIGVIADRGERVDRYTG